MRLLIAGLSVVAACSPDPVVRASAPAASAAVPAVSAVRDADVRIPDASGRASDDGLAIVEAPITWSGERERLTLEYRRAHSDPDAKDLAIEPKVIVLHYTGGMSAEATRAYFDAPRIEPARKELARAGAVNVSSHFLVDRDGTIYRLQPETR